MALSRAVKLLFKSLIDSVFALLLPKLRLKPKAIKLDAQNENMIVVNNLHI